MFTKSSLVAFVALALTFAITNDAFAGTRHSRGRSRPIFGSSRSCCVVVNPCVPSATAPTATAAAPGTYRSYSYEPSAPAPVYRYEAPAPSDMSRFLLPKTDPRRYSGGR